VYFEDDFVVPIVFEILLFLILFCKAKFALLLPNNKNILKIFILRHKKC